LFYSPPTLHAIADRGNPLIENKNGTDRHDDAHAITNNVFVVRVSGSVKIHINDCGCRSRLPRHLGHGLESIKAGVV